MYQWQSSNKNNNKNNNSDPLEKLMEETSALHVDDDFESVFHKSVDYPKFCPKDLMRKIVTIERDSKICGREIRFLIKFYLHLTSEKRLSVTSEGYKYYQELMKKYHIEKKSSIDNVTLHRIAASFPIVGVNLLRTYKIERKFSTAMLKEKHANDFPWCMRTQMCLSLAPMEPEFTRDRDYRNVIYAIIVFMYYENKHANNRVFAPMERFEKVLNIAHTVYLDSLIDPMKKRHVWNQIMYDYTVNKKSVENLLKYFRAEIPEAEAIFANRFDLVEKNKNMVYQKPRNVEATKK